MTQEEKYELFDRYCSKELSSAQEEILIKMVKEDDALAKEFALYQELNSHLEARFVSEQEKETLENNLKEIGNSYFTKKRISKETKVIKIPVWAYGAVASIVLIFGVYFFNQSDPVYSDYANVPELSISERGSTEEDGKKAEHAFNSEDYVKAEEYLLVLLSKDKENTAYQFYYGISLLEQGKYSRATQAFEGIYKNNSSYKYKALWFEALNQLKQKKYDQCVVLLKGIPKDAEDYNQAQKLIHKLK
ncbi:tetratricopeptide repeat protein [Aquimarina aquimarini]|uniref:tetratricopeptide repeat protein n=1 Tax=Aquimarina aquimarini TaxID=1191734 RepID=UPI000D560D98|nr:tetratricopeptide repeat protein [Aquimarina aquimarini]